MSPLLLIAIIIMVGGFAAINRFGMCYTMRARG
jgi:hypothetical protein